MAPYVSSHTSWCTARSYENGALEFTGTFIAVLLLVFHASVTLVLLNIRQFQR